MNPQRSILALVAVGLALVLLALWVADPGGARPPGSVPTPAVDLEARAAPSARTRAPSPADPAPGEGLRAEQAPSPILLAGHVARLDGGPLPAALEIAARGPEGELPPLGLEDPAGTFRIELAAGEWRLEARAPGWLSPGLDLLLDPRAAPAEARLLLLPTATLILCVEDPGPPRESPLEIFLECSAGGEPRVGRIEADGCVRFDGLLAAPKRVRVGHPLHPWVEAFELELEAPLTRPAAIALPPRSDLPIRVLDAAGQPVVGAQVQGLGRRGGWVEARTGPAGDAQLRGLPAGRARVQASAPGSGQTDQALELAPGPNPELVLRLRARPAGP